MAFTEQQVTALKGYLKSFFRDANMTNGITKNDDGYVLSLTTRTGALTSEQEDCIRQAAEVCGIQHLLDFRGGDVAIQKMVNIEFQNDAKRGIA